MTTRIGSGSIGSGGSSRATKFGPVVADELIRRVGEDAREVCVLRIFHRLGEFDPEEAAARFARGVFCRSGRRATARCPAEVIFGTCAGGVVIGNVIASSSSGLSCRAPCGLWKFVAIA